TVVNPEPIPSAVMAFGLGLGESAVLAHALAIPGGGAIIDDQAARKAASSLGIPHIGTLGIIIQAKSLAIIPAARPLLEQLRKQGMYLSDQVLNQALAQVGE